MTPDDLLARMRPWAARKASAMLPAGEVDDATQEGLIAAWRASARLDPARDPWPLLTIAARSAIARYARRYYAAPRPAVVREEPGRFDATAEAALAGIASARVRAALAGLTPRERSAVVLVDMLDVAPEEAARSLGLDPKAGALRQARRRAHSKLREALKGVAA